MTDRAELLARLRVFRDKCVEGFDESSALFVTQQEIDDLHSAITLIEADARDAERLDFLEDPARTYWIAIQTQPDGKHIRAGQGAGTRAAIDAALKEPGNG